MGKKKASVAPSSPRKDRLTVRVSLTFEVIGTDDKTAPQEDIREELQKALSNQGRTAAMRSNARHLVEEALWRAIRVYARDNDTADTLTARASIVRCEVSSGAVYDRCPKAIGGYHIKDDRGNCRFCEASLT